MKTYVKPDLYYEDFELSNSVAGGCVDSLNHSQEQCSYSNPDKLGITETIFSTVCDIDFEAAEGEIYCYFSGEDEGLPSLFTS